MGAFDGLRDGQVQTGYYGPHTSTIDWCESNYTHSRFIAEFYNTLTNVPSILLGLYGAYRSYKNGVRKRYALTYLGLSLIGIGSFGFHASLRWEWQLMDELPMIYVVSHAFYLIIDTLPSFSPRFGILGPLLLIAWDIFVTLSYLYLPNPIYHQVAFAAIMLTAVGRNVTLILRLPTLEEQIAASAPSTPAVDIKGQESDKQLKIGSVTSGKPKLVRLTSKVTATGHGLEHRIHVGTRAKISRTMVQGIIIFALGFAIWNIDNVFCQRLREWREPLGEWGFVLQGHGYWHLMTGYGSFLIFSASTLLQLAVKVSPDAFDYDETDWFPTVYKVPSDEILVVVPPSEDDPSRPSS